MISERTVHGAARDHTHELSLEDTFEFLNTIELENGFLDDHFVSFRDAVGRLAEPLVDQIQAGNADRIRICANDTCRWIFYDESRAGRRRWCDMASCGNRAKAARHRARVKAAATQRSS